MNQHWWCSTFAVFIFLYMIQYLPYCKPFFLQPTPTQIHMYTYKLDSSCANIKRKWMQKHCAAVNLHCSNQFETCTVSVYKLVKGKKQTSISQTNFSKWKKLASRTGIMLSTLGVLPGWCRWTLIRPTLSLVVGKENQLWCRGWTWISRKNNSISKTSPATS